MKKLLAVLMTAAVVLLSRTAQAQTNSTGLIGSLSQPVQTIATYLEANTNALKATNWTVAPYGSITKSPTSGKTIYGGGLAAVYYFNPYIGTQIRAQYLNLGGGTSPLWLPNGTVTLQSTYQPFGQGIPLTIRPMIEAGAATDLKGHAMAIAGTGGEIDLWTSSKQTTVQRVSVFYGIEKWQGAIGNPTVQQFGVAVNLDLAPVISWIANLKL
jgi:hypothetical protein